MNKLTLVALVATTAAVQIREMASPPAGTSGEGLGPEAAELGGAAVAAVAAVEKKAAPVKLAAAGGDKPDHPATAGAANDGTQPRWGIEYPKMPERVVLPENWAVPSTKPTMPGPLGSANGDSQSFIAKGVSLAQVTPAGNVPTNADLTAGAAAGNQPRWGSRYPVPVKPVAAPINWAQPSTKTKAGPLGGSNGDSQSFMRYSLMEATPAGNVPTNADLTAGAAAGNQPRWGSRYPVPVKPVAAPINWAQPSTKTKAGPLGGSNGDSQSFLSHSFMQATPATNVPKDAGLTAGAPAGNQPRWGSRYPVPVKPVAAPINWAQPSTKTKAGPLGGSNGDSQSFLTIAPANRVTPAHPVFEPSQTAGAPADGTKPRFGTPYNLKQVTPDHPEFKPDLTAGAPAPAEPRFGSAYRGYNAVQSRARSLGGVAVRF